jgi:hypothetical protein
VKIAWVTFAHLARREIAAPCFDADRHRAAAGADHFAVTADFIADKDRLMKHHAVDRHRGAAPARSLDRQIAAGKIHLRQKPAAEDVPFGLASAGIAITRISGATAGNSGGGACGAFSLVKFITLQPTA